MNTKWIGRFFLLIRVIGWIFFNINDRLITASLNVFFVIGLVFMYEDWWQVILWLVKVNKKWDELMETPQFQRAAQWFIIVSLPIGSIAMLFAAFYYPFDFESGGNLVGICLGTVFFALWLVLFKNWKAK